MAPFTLKWGIVATGGIAEQFIKDLIADPALRGVSDVAHLPVAVASRSVEKAQAFIDAQVPADLRSKVTPYGSYEELYKDPAVDVVYVASPSAFHYKNSLDALRAGKNVLCEKPFTVNAKQAKHLQHVAKESNLFLMEAVWTRFFPLVKTFTKLLHEDKVIGRVHRVFSDFSVWFDPKTRPTYYDPNTGGGALLDLGVYMNLWTLLTCYHHPDNKLSPPDVIKAVQFRSAVNRGVDESTSVITSWEKPQIVCIGTASMMIDTPPECVVRVQGTKGQIIIPIHGSRPEKILVRLDDGATREYNFPIPGQGLFWEADAVARDIRDGKKEEALYPLSESVFAMELMDEIRRQNELVFPANVEYCEDF
ncbi:NAD(P)-binding protein [Myxozyma melibiosi]|uniref:D-xylose 1-dehydrogenase (NADP(+), D-xylono-1,5-lactone-forming) n=1 Tax=Myxozyma melibiosi TaxID=54550 RepID=A0ABR1FCU4_9ASCO